MGLDCYCNCHTEQGSIPVPPVDKTVDPINNLKNEELNYQEAYNRNFTTNKNDFKTNQSNKNDYENNNISNNDKYNNIKNTEKNISEFDKNIKLYSIEMTEEEFISKINKKIKEIDSKFGSINQNKKDEYIKNKEKNIIFKSPLFFKETNNIYFGSWDIKTLKKEGWGILLDKVGNKYEGGWDKDIIDGYCRIISINGDYYEGEIANGIIEGNGIFYSDEKKMIYKGEFKNNCFDGDGEQIFQNFEKKIIYQGKFKNGKREGIGKIIFEDGNIYEGEFSNDNFNGEGCFRWTDGREYKGKWNNNKMNGKGIFIWDKNNWYEGEYKDNKREGFGIYQYGDNNYYEGKWLNNLPQGEGKINKDGKTVEGVFRYGKMIRNKNNKKEFNNTGNIINYTFKNESVN